MKTKILAPLVEGVAIILILISLISLVTGNWFALVYLLMSVAIYLALRSARKEEKRWKKMIGIF